MKSLSSMSAGSGQSKSSNRGQVIRSCLPIVGTALLIVFLGGFPPTTWVLLFQTFGQLNLLLMYHGPGMIVPLIILIVQSLMLALAWGLLGWVMLREGAYIMTMQSKAELDRLLAFQSTSGELINPSQMVTKQLPTEPDFDGALNKFDGEPDFDGASDMFDEEPDFDGASDMFDEEPDFDEESDRFDEEQDFDVRTAPLGQEQDYAVRTASLRRGRERDVTTAPLRRGRERDVTTAPLRRGREFDVTTAPLSMATSHLGMTTSPLREEVPEEEVSWGARSVQSRSRQLPSVQSRNMQLLSAPSHNVQLPRTQSRSVQQSSTQSRSIQQSSTQSRSIGTQPRGVQPTTQLRDVQSRSVQRSSAPSRDVQSRNGHTSSAPSRGMQSRNGHTSSAPSQRTSSLRRGSSIGRQREEDLLENPFDKELPPTPETENVEPQRNRMVTKKEEPPEEENEEDDNPFVYGNPFDGPLPEVFRYDTELRRSVMEMTEEETSQSNGSKTKGSGTQKTKYP